MKINHSFIDYLSVLIRWKKFIIFNFFIICLITAAISLIIPKWYKSQATLLPPSDESGLNFSAILSNLPMGGLGLGGAMDQGTSVVVAIVNSRSLRENVVKKFDLIKRFKAENMEDAVRTLASRAAVDISDEGMIKISCKTKTGYLAGKQQESEARQLSQEITAYIVEEVDKIDMRLKNEKATNNRIFIEKRYQKNVDDLKKAEEELKTFQEENGVLLLPDQLQASITAIAEMKAKITIQQVELDYQSHYMDKNHPEYIRAVNRLNALKKEYEKMQHGAMNADNVIIPLTKAPALGVKYARLYREVMLQEKIMEFLLPQYEQAKIQEAKDTSTIQVLDSPSLPIKRIKPKRAFLVIFAGFASLLLSFFVVYMAMILQHLEENKPSDFKKIKSIMHELNPRSFFK